MDDEAGTSDNRDSAGGRHRANDDRSFFGDGDYIDDGHYADNGGYVDPRNMVLRAADGRCLNCSDIDFEQFFSLNTSPRPIASIRVALAMIALEYCSFCKLLTDAVAQLTAPRKPPSYSSQPDVTFYFERIYQQGIWNDTTFRKSSGVAMKVTIRPAPFPLSLANSSFMILPVFRNSSDDRIHSGRLVIPTHADLRLAEQWLTTCDALHGKGCVEPSYLVARRNLPTFRVIDVQDMCVKPGNPGCRYVALSYVWGNVPTLMLMPSNIDELQRKGSLSSYAEQLPQTIRDAMEVVKGLGERYLWVDCLCILQADEKIAQMEAMDQIFGSACLTIVAACGVDASAGLSGVRPISRNIRQISWTVTEQLTLAVALQNPDAIVNARWSSRGWTLQEALLGKRFLIFRDDQMIWQCRLGMEFEDTLGDFRTHPYQGLRQLPMNKIINIPLKASARSKLAPLLRTQDVQLYMNVVEDYTCRYLTETNDILNAFGGLNKIFDHMFGARMLSGLPESYLDVALLWQPKVVLKRRSTRQKSFPSWSWAGRIGEISYPKGDTEENVNQEGVVPLLRWFISSSTSGKVDQIELQPINEIGIGIVNGSNKDEKTLSTIMWFPVFEASQDANIPTDLIAQCQTAQQYHYLGFWTSAAFLPIERKQDEVGARDQRLESKHPPLEYQIRNKHGYTIGHVTMNGQSPTQTEKERHEFIVVSGAQALGFDVIRWRDAFSPQPGRWEMYNVLLVEWNEHKTIAQRVGLGRVLKSAWTTGSPKRKFVVLG